MAVARCWPTEIPARVFDAEAVPPLRMAEEEVFWPSMAKVTLPLGTGSLGRGFVAATAAVKVMELPAAIGWEESVRRVEVELEEIPFEMTARLMRVDVEGE